MDVDVVAVRSRFALGFALVSLGLGSAHCGTQSAGAGSGRVDADAGSAGGSDAGGPASADAGPGGVDGGVSADCAGVVPDSLGRSFSFDVPRPSSGTPRCESASSDEYGNIVASNRSGPPGANWSWELFSPSGEHAGHLDAASLLPQAPGWEGVYWSDPNAGPSFPLLGYWLPDGTLQQHTPAGSDEAAGVTFRSWPNGTVVVTVGCSGAAPPGTLIVRRFDATGHLVSSGDMPGGCNGLLAAVGDANGNSLVLLPGGSGSVGGTGVGFDKSDLVGRWLDGSGKAITPFFVVAAGALTGGNTVLLHAVVGGGAMVALDGAWRWSIGSGSTEVGPAADWLASHAGYDFTIVRGGRAYALLPRTAGDRQVMDLYSTQGNRCGSLTFPVGGLTTGADGTAIGASGDSGCTKTVWPGLLR